MSLIKLLCLLLLCYIVSCSASKREKQHCGDYKFYCPSTDKCLDRKLRCTASKACVDSGGKEAKCFEHSPGRYNYYRKETPLTGSGSSSRRKRSYDLAHWFLEYRGFVYEFASYGVQELDVNDPNYKYGPGREKVTAQELVGTSSCTRKDILRFIEEFKNANPKYDLYTNNCQDFVKLLIKRMKNNCSTRKRRSLDDEEDLKSHCSVPNSSNSMLALNWKPFASFATLILLTIFCM